MTKTYNKEAFEIIEKMAEEDPQEEKAIEEVIEESPEEDLQTEEKVPSKGIQYPGKLIDISPTEEGKPAVKRYAPSSPSFVQCPVCQSRHDPLTKGKEKFLFLGECPTCSQLYDKIEKTIERYNIPAPQAIEALSQTLKYDKGILQKIYDLKGGDEFPNIYNELKSISETKNISPEEAAEYYAKEKGWSLEFVKQILDSQGESILFHSEIEQRAVPSMHERVQHALNYRLNVQRDENGHIKYDRNDNPLPLKTPRFYTTYDLAKKMRWHPDFLTSKLEASGIECLPYGGMSREKAPYVEKEESALSPKELELKQLQVGFKDLQKENPSHPQLATMRNKINNLEKEVEEEKRSQEKGKQTRFQKSWLNVWDIEMAQDVLKERAEEVQNIIKPLERVNNLGFQIKKHNEKAEKLQSESDKLQKTIQAVAENIDEDARKEYKALLDMRNAEPEERKKTEQKIGKTFKQLEKDRGKELDRHLKHISRIQKQQQILDSEAEELKEISEGYVEKFIEQTGNMGYKWYDDQGNVIMDINDAIFTVNNLFHELTDEVPELEE